MNTQSLWLDTAASPDFPKLIGRVETDVLIVGGGITGITTAYLLSKAGVKVAVVDQQSIGGGETSHTTAHVTYVTDSRLSELVERFGESKARAFWDAGFAAMGQIERIVRELDIDCDLKHVPGYLFAAVGSDSEKESESLRKEAELAASMDFDAAFLATDPVFQRPSVRFSNQLKFHPLKYLNALARAASAAGAQIFSKTSGSDIDPKKHELETSTGVISYHTLVAATHIPIQGERGTLGAALFQTKLALYSTYAIEAEIGKAPEALFWDTKDPYHYYRIDDDGCSVIAGGEDHKTGQVTDTEQCYKNLEHNLRMNFANAKLKHRWSGQVVETPDGMPYIGEVGEHQLLATGFSGNGMTLGTFAAMMIRDRLTGKPNAWSDLFDPSRKTLSSAWEYVRENADFPAYFIKEHLSSAPSEKPARGTGEVVKVEGKKCAVYRDEKGKTTELSPICPHMGCIVHWNTAEKTWDCPCHGSRFMATGELIAGPAETGLEPVK